MGVVERDTKLHLGGGEVERQPDQGPVMIVLYEVHGAATAS